MSHALTVRSLDAGYAGKTIVHDINVTVQPRRTLSVVGPSGAGKSTLLRAIAGLQGVRAGKTHVGDRDVTALVPQQRRIAMVFAQDALVRHLRVRENLALVQRDAKGTSNLLRLAEAFEIDRHLNRRPGELSTGERQRVSIVRALLCDPDVLLLDEPLASLDPQLRARVREELLHVRERFGGPMIFVTHDHADAMTVADELAVLIDGRIVDRGDPQRVFDAPATLGVATFLGIRPMNVLPGERFGLSPETVAGLRPEALSFDHNATLRGFVVRVERTGADAYVHVTSAGASLLVRVDAGALPALGSEVGIAYDRSNLRCFDRTTGMARV